MNPQDVKSEIQALQNTGVSKERIYAALINKGVPVDTIMLAYGLLYSASPEAMNTSAAQINTNAQTTASVVVEREENQGSAVNRLVMIGASLIGIGVITLVYSNWQSFPSTLKVLILLVVMLVCYGVGFAFFRSEKYKKAGEGIIFLGSLVYGANIFLIAQIYNIHAEYCDGYILWMLGVFLLSYSLRLNSLRGLAVFLAFCAIGGYTSIFDTMFAGTSSYYLSNSLVFLSAVVLFVAALVLKDRLPANNADFY